MIHRSVYTIQYPAEEPLRLTRHPAPLPDLLRLIGLASVRFAIGRAGLRVPAAEVEFLRAGIADGPAAHAVVDRHHTHEAAVFKLDGLFLHNGQLGLAA